MPIEPGTILNDRYVVDHLHKLGTQGAIYLAKDRNQGVHVALKENLVATQEHARHFLLETRILANLRHPNLPRAFDHFIDDSGQFFAMDWIEGENLADWLTHDILPARKLIPMLRGLFQALEYLHSRIPPIIHRDVEPSNIILTPTGHVVLVDFGFAKVFDPSLPSPGTDARTDQYSLAATIFALLTRHIPTDALERASGREAYVPATFYDPGIPPPVNEALEHAMAMRPDDRYKDIATFWEALNHEA